MLCPSIKGYDKVFKEAEIVHSWHAMLQCSVPWEVTALLGDCMSDFTETLLLSFLLAEMWMHHVASWSMLMALKVSEWHCDTYI